MNSLSTGLTNRSKQMLISVVTALSITLFLFYIDEGYYDLRWMKEPGNWMIFVVYVLFMLGGQIMISRLFFQKPEGWLKIILTVAGGATVFLTFLAILYYLVFFILRNPIQ